MIRICTFVLLIAGGSVLARDLRPASINLQGRRLSGRPSTRHSAIAQAIHVTDSEDCGVKQVGPSTLEVSDKCKYLRGAYRYVFIEPETQEKRQILVGFALTRTSGAEHAFLANEPIEARESDLAD